MLHINTVSPTALELLKTISQASICQQFTLAGGTALALQIGHRISIDLDFFTQENFDSQAVTAYLMEFEDCFISAQRADFIQASIQNVKIDFFKFPYEVINNIHTVDSIRLLNIEQIAIMKLLAVGRRGVRKDFVDLFFLLRYFDLGALMEKFQLAFPKVNPIHILKSLTYFEDAEYEAPLQMLLPADWKDVKRHITEAVRLLVDKF